MKTHSCRRVGGAETGSWVERTHGKVVAGGPSEATDCGVGQANLQLASKAATGGPGHRLHKPRAPAWGNKASNHWLKPPVGVEAAAGKTPSLTGEVIGETKRVLEHTQANRPGNQHQQGPLCLWVAEEVTKQAESWASAIAPSRTPPPHIESQCNDEHYPTPVNT